MLVDFGPPRICLHDGGSICLVPPDPFYRYFRSGGIYLLVPPDRFRGTESNVTRALIYNGRKVNRTLKTRMIKTGTGMDCGSEIWSMRKADIKRLEAFDLWTWRSTEGVSWTERKTNEEVLETIGEYTEYKPDKRSGSDILSEENDC